MNYLLSNTRLFEWINAAADAAPWRIALATALAQWLIYVIPAALTLAWMRGDALRRNDLLEMVVAVVLALGLGQIITHAWPQPRPFVLHVGTQFIPHDPDPGFPSDHVTVFCALGFAALHSRRLKSWAVPLFGGGVVVGWSRIYLGIHFSYDVLGGAIVGFAGSQCARMLRRILAPVFAAMIGQRASMMRR